MRASARTFTLTLTLSL
ncbi:hypothetical protein EC80569_0136, partial [Escherichia coli 8.0569]